MPPWHTDNLGTEITEAQQSQEEFLFTFNEISNLIKSENLLQEGSIIMIVSPHSLQHW